jgi:hypothetical protein
MPDGGHGIVSWLSKALWSPRAQERLKTPLPQVVPFKYSTRPVYSFEDWDRRVPPPLGRLWWSKGETGGAGRGPVSYAPDHNALKSAWAMGLWGSRLGQPAWKSKADQALRLWLAAPGLAPRQYDPDAQVYTLDDDADAGWASGTWATVWIRTRTDRPPHPEAASRIGSLVSLAERAVAGSRPMFDFLAEVVRTEALPAHVRDRARRVIARSEAGAGSSLETRLAHRLARCEAVGDDPSEAEALADELALRQSVWERPGMPVDWFGSIGPALHRSPADDLALLLMRAGAATGRQDLFERGVASLRSAFAVFREAAASLNGVRVAGDLPANCLAVGAAGPDLDPVPAGFDAGEGAMLAHATYALERFGSLYIHPDGWSVGVDAVALAEDGAVISLLVNNPRPYLGEFPVTVRRGQSLEEPVQPEERLAVSRIDLDWDGKGLVVTAVPSLPTLRPDETAGRFRFLPSGPVVPARVGARGFEARISLAEFRDGPVEFEGRIGKARLRSRPALLLTRPELRQSAPAPRGYVRTGGLARVWSPVRGQLGTGDDGQSDAPNAGLVGSLRSAPFLATPFRMRFILAGQGTANLKVVAEDDGAELWSSRPPAAPAPTEIDFGRWAGRLVRLVFDDSTPEGWIEVREPTWIPATGPVSRKPRSPATR